MTADLQAAPSAVATPAQSFACRCKDYFACIRCRPIFRMESAGARPMAGKTAPPYAKMLEWLDDQKFDHETLLPNMIKDQNHDSIAEVHADLRIIVAIRTVLASLPSSSTADTEKP